MLPSTGMNIVGYSCAFCGYYVYPGNYHQCVSQAKVACEPYKIVYPDPIFVEIRDLLKQLIELMEKQT